MKKNKKEIKISFFESFDFWSNMNWSGLFLNTRFDKVALTNFELPKKKLHNQLTPLFTTLQQTRRRHGSIKIAQFENNGKKLSNNV